MLISPKRITIKKSLSLSFSTTNNEAEYEALLAGVVMVKKLGGKAIEIFSDSRLIVGQVNGELEARDHRMWGYLNKAQKLQSSFESFSIQQIPRRKNTHANFLETLATLSKQSLPQVILVEDLFEPTEPKLMKVGMHQIRVSLGWIDPIVAFLKDEVLPQDRGKAEKIRRKAPHFWLSKRSFSGPYLLCIHPEVEEPLLEELHERICGNHTKGRLLSHRAFTQGYWWLSMQKEV